MLEPSLEAIIEAGVERVGLSQASLPARSFLEKSEQGGARELRKHELAHERVLAGCAPQEAKLEKQRAALVELRERIKTELKDSLPLERAGLREALGTVQIEIRRLDREHSRLLAPLRNEERATERLRSRIVNEGKFFENLLQQFPDAKILDLRCLAVLKNKQGLPALTLVSLDSPITRIEVHRNSLGIYAGTRAQSDGIICPKQVLSELAGQIEKATGVKAARRTNYWGESQEFYIRLTQKMQIGAANVIPTEARQTIRAALNSKLFDEVVLLTEVQKWKIEYVGEPLRTPRLQGEVILKPQTRDPLILGLKKLASGPVACIVGSFDTTAVEEYARAEWALRPKVRK